MKKISLFVISLLFLTLLFACQSSKTSEKPETKEPTYHVQLTVDFGDEVKEESFSFKKGETVMDLLQQHFKIEEKDGLVTSINGVSQKPSESVYWMYDVNQKMAEKGVKEQKLSDGDKIVFYLKKF